MIKEKSIQEKVDERTVRNFWITNCPERVWKEFKEFAEKETNNNYSIALKLLLGTSKTSAKERLLYERYIQLDSRLRQVEINLVEMSKAIQSFSLLIDEKENEEIEESIEDDKPKKVNVPVMGGSKISVPDTGE